MILYTEKDGPITASTRTEINFDDSQQYYESDSSEKQCYFFSFFHDNIVD